jgi:hypothetical protein
MLKLMKYEFIHSMRTFTVSYAVFLGMCFIFPFFISQESILSFPFLDVFFGFGFSFLLFGIMIALFVSLFTNYYQSMFKRPAYLTLTLPVSTTQLILSKVLMSLIWLCIGVMVLGLGMFILTMMIGVLESQMTFVEVLNIFIEILQSFGQYIFFNTPIFLKDILSIVSVLIFLVGSIYFALTVSHTKWLRKHRLILGIALYIFMNIVIEYIASSLFDEVFSFMSITSNHELFISIYYLIIGLLLISGTIYTVDHYIEIE